MTQQSDKTWFERIPKAELHLHLEGAIPHEALWELIQKYGGDPSVPDLESLERRFVYQDFRHFLQTWEWKNGFLREYEDFAFIAEKVSLDLASQNILYAETFFSPTDFFRHGLKTQKIAEAIRTGLSRVPETDVALVADLVRDFGPVRAAETLEELKEIKELGVVGIGIGGSEHEHPPEPFAEVFEKARRYGFHTSAHAGEAAGANSVWGAIRSLKADRIGHGTRAFEDLRLLDHLAERGTPLEMCPLSNLRTGVVGSAGEHPIRRYFEKGIVVTVNTDDPKMFGNSLADEYMLLEEELGFSRDEIRSLILQAVRASWMPEGKKRNLMEKIQGSPAWQIHHHPESPR
jgi:adenosine deaminase